MKTTPPASNHESRAVQHTPTPPTTAGGMLREARLRLGLSLADVAAVTRIPRNMLEHLERDRFDEYAAPVFARGHLINFAREVRLDPESVLLAYERQSGNMRPSLEFEPPTHVPRASKHATSSSFSLAAIKRKFPQLRRIADTVRPIHMVTAVLLIVALFAGAFFLNGANATAQNPAEFAPSNQEEWSLEKDVDQTRWFLEQPSAPPTTP